jgi:hypothetical protein
MIEIDCSLILIICPVEFRKNILIDVFMATDENVT